MATVYDSLVPWQSYTVASYFAGDHTDYMVN